MAQEALRDAQARLDQLQKQRDEAFSAWRANPSSDLEKECYEDLKISLHKAEDAVNSLAAAAASTSGGRAFIVTTVFWLCLWFCLYLASMRPLSLFCGSLLCGLRIGVLFVCSWERLERLDIYVHFGSGPVFHEQLSNCCRQEANSNTLLCGSVA